MLSETDFYELLGVNRDATPEEIRHAYHKAARKLHPDVNIESGQTELFLEIQQAYDILSNPQKRAEYDRTLPPLPVHQPSILTTMLYSRSTLPRINEPQLVYVLLDLTAPARPDTIQRPPLNLCLVLDRSTSMQGVRMDTVKNAAIELVRKLRPEDTLSIVTFSDRAEVLIPAGRQQARPSIETQIQMIQTGGATEMFRGLEAGFFETQVNYSKRSVNHIILLTDGRTYGDEENCLRIADQAANINIGISCMGIGEEWNDAFLDTLAVKTGGSCVYVSKPSDIHKLLNEKFLELGQVYAEVVSLDFNTSKDIELTYAFRLGPQAGPLSTQGPIKLGNLPNERNLSIVLEFRVPPLPEDINQINLISGRISIEVPSQSEPTATSALRLTCQVKENAEHQPPPTSLVRALSKLTLYRLQERAHDELLEGKIERATQHLHNLATHLFSEGEQDLARFVLAEAENIQSGHSLSELGKKRIKYGTRALLLPGKLSEDPAAD